MDLPSGLAWLAFSMLLACLLVCLRLSLCLNDDSADADSQLNVTASVTAASICPFLHFLFFCLFLAFSQTFKAHENSISGEKTETRDTSDDVKP